MNIPLATPPVGGTTSLIRSILPSLGPSEQKVARECVEFAEEVALLSVADLAARTGVSPATVVRTCQNLGFKGFQHLRLLLLRDLGAAVQTTSTELIEGSRGRVPQIFEDAARELRDALGALDYDQFDAAARAIAEAGRVFIVANGGSGPSGQSVALRFLTTGRPCEAPYDAVTQQVAARLLTPNDVCLAISDSGMNGVTLKAVEAAHAAGATIVGVTSYARSRLSELSNHTIVAGAAFHSWTEGAVAGNIAQILILSALQNAVSVLNGAAGSLAGEVIEEVFAIVGDKPTP
jgi:RpiR family carbohydrate utilization transcriptional regulator